MEIRQFRVVIRSSNFEHAMKFYAGALALPQIESWNREDERGAVFQAGAALLEVLGPPASEDPRDSDERFVGQGPLIKATLVFDVPSAQKAYEEIQFREKNIPGTASCSPTTLSRSTSASASCSGRRTTTTGRARRPSSPTTRTTSG